MLEGLLTDISHGTEFLATKLRLTQFATLRERQVHYLFDQMNAQQSRCIELPVSKQELAHTLGAARQSVSRCFSELEEAGILRVSGRSVEIIDSRRLHEFDVDAEIGLSLP
mgnify:CR=1 FL=1